MARIGCNLWTLRDRFLQLLEGAASSSSSLQHPDSEFFAQVNEAQRALQATLRVVRQVAGSLDAVAGVATLAMPDDALATDILQLTYLKNRLNRTGWALSWLDGTTGVPVAWAPDPARGDQIVINPAPVESGTGAFALLYNAQPRPLSRMWAPTAITVAVTQGSPVVTFSGVLADVRADDEFGVRPTTQCDGTALSGQSPFLWYRVQSVDTVAKTATLSSNYLEATNGAAQFVTAQVSDLEIYRPGKLGLILAEYAVALVMSARDPEAAAGMASMVAGALAAYRDDTTGYTFAEPNFGAKYPGAFERY